MASSFKIGPTTFLSTVALWERLRSGTGGALVDPAPLNTVQPFLSGTGYTDSPLSVQPGIWYGNPYPTFEYQWQLWNTSTLAWDNIPGATLQDYTPIIVGDYRALVTGSNPKGFKTVESDTMAVQAALRAPTNSVAPSISPTSGVVGAVLTADPGSWSAIPPVISYAYQWQRDIAGVWTDIAGATSQTFTTTNTGGHRVKVIATNLVGPGDPAYSSSVTIGSNVTKPAMISSPVISGNAYVGSTLRAIPGTWSGSPTFNYQWLVQDTTTQAWNPIPSATSSTYVAAEAKPHRCDISASNSGGTTTAPSNTLTVSNLPAGVTTSYLNNGNYAGGAANWTLAAGAGVTMTNGKLEINSTGNVTVDQPGTSMAAIPAAGTTLNLGFNITRYVDGTLNPRVRYTDGTFAYFYNSGDPSVGTGIAGGSASVGAKSAPALTLDPAKTVERFSLRGNIRNGVINVDIDDWVLTSTTPPPLSKPALDFSPQIRGTPDTGATLYTTVGVWFGNPEPTYTIVWQVFSGGTWVTAPGSTNSTTYVPTTAGDYRTSVTATNSEGSTVATSAAFTVSGAGTTPGAGTYSRFQIVFDQTWGAPEVMIADVWFRVTPGSTPSMPGQPYASSQSGILTPENAFDGNPDTWWSPLIGADEAPYLGILVTGAPTTLGQVAITFPNVEVGFFEAAPRNFRIQGWDGTNWVTLKNVTDEPRWGAGVTRTYTI